MLYEVITDRAAGRHHPAGNRPAPRALARNPRIGRARPAGDPARCNVATGRVGSRPEPAADRFLLQSVRRAAFDGHRARNNFV